MVKMYLERIKSHIKVRVFIICERLIVLLPRLFYASGSVPVLSFVYRSARRERLFFHIGNYNNTRKGVSRQTLVPVLTTAILRHVSLGTSCKNKISKE